MSRKNNKLTTTPYDHSYKLLFSQQVLVRDLLRGFVPQDWVAQLDFDTLEKVGTEYISNELLKRSNDLVWRLKLGGDKWLYVYVMLEFQSSNERWMALRLMTYIGLLYQDLIRNKKLSANNRLPPIFPIVIHNGQTRWTSPMSLAELIEQVPGDLASYCPQLKYFLLDEGCQLTDRPEQRDNFAADLIDLECSASSEDALGVIKRLGARLRSPENRPLADAFKAWIEAVLFKRLYKEEDIPALDTFEEVTTVIEERIDQWREDIRREALRAGLQKGLDEGREAGRLEGRQEGRTAGREQGLEEGREQGLEEGREEGREEALELARKASCELLRKLLLVQVEQRFGPVSQSTRSSFDDCDQGQLESMFTRISVVESLAQLREAE